eukprot:TRINITY_DN14213_c0_g1_i1.p1 TRINITY_DN14213_c0_g1~~TRINITY_DN14213_c0_g1_i1.p1  ORF type:complete len:1130 (+),score=282.00 TRINITY_DN14213_c0_g1_i1:270-3392(+)
MATALAPQKRELKAGANAAVPRIDLLGLKDAGAGRFLCVATPDGTSLSSPTDSAGLVAAAPAAAERGAVAGRRSLPVPGAGSALSAAVSGSASARAHATPRSSIGGGSSCATPARGDRATQAPGDIQLAIRVRAGSGPQLCATADEESAIVRLNPSLVCRTQMYETSFGCDEAFGPESSQATVFERAAAPICDAVLQGYNGAVIAYGQTGSGKTYTMVGGGAPSATGSEEGMAPRAIRRVFAHLAAGNGGWRVQVSALEVYNERVRDLLAGAGNHAATNLDVHEVMGERSENGGAASFRCPGATHRDVTRPEEAMAALLQGMERRETGRTDMNHKSSRSHLVFSLTITQLVSDTPGGKLRSRLHLVDLAGSERLKRTMSHEFAGRYPVCQASRDPSSKAQLTGQQKRETAEINKSLLQLALVIQRLSASAQSGTRQYIPYRDAVLTRLLAESFGGNSRTCLIITCSPSVENREETRSSLEFGRRAKLVKNVPRVNLEVEAVPAEAEQSFELERSALLAERSEMEERHSREEHQLREEAAGARARQEELQRRAMDLERDHSILQEEALAERRAREALEQRNAELEAELLKLRNALQAADALAEREKRLREAAEAAAEQEKRLREAAETSVEPEKRLREAAEASAEREKRLREAKASSLWRGVSGRLLRCEQERAALWGFRARSEHAEKMHRGCEVRSQQQLAEQERLAQAAQERSSLEREALQRRISELESRAAQAEAKVAATAAAVAAAAPDGGAGAALERLELCELERLQQMQLSMQDLNLQKIFADMQTAVSHLDDERAPEDRAALAELAAKLEAMTPSPCRRRFAPVGTASFDVDDEEEEPEPAPVLATSSAQASELEVAWDVCPAVAVAGLQDAMDWLKGEDYFEVDDASPDGSAVAPALLRFDGALPTVLPAAAASADAASDPATSETADPQETATLAAEGSGSGSATPPPRSRNTSGPGTPEEHVGPDGELRPILERRRRLSERNLHAATVRFDMALGDSDDEGCDHPRVLSAEAEDAATVDAEPAVEAEVLAQ